MGHVPHPWQFVREIAQGLKPGGLLILSVPFLFYIHGEPHDYYRYTPYALRNLFEENRFSISHMEMIGGIWAFAGLFVQTALLCTTYGIPWLGSLGWEANRLLTVLTNFLDRLLGMAQSFPVGVLAVACIQASGSREEESTHEGD